MRVPGNAVSLASTPVFDALWASRPAHAAHGVRPRRGLPEGQMGNSEVGHLNLGAGSRRAPGPHTNRRRDRRTARWPATRCCGAAFEPAAGRPPAPAGAVPRWRRARGLRAPARPESARRRARACRTSSWPRSPTAATRCRTPARTLVETRRGLAARQAASAGSRTATTGRYFAMDRDRRWDRTQPAYDAPSSHGRADAPDAESGAAGGARRLRARRDRRVRQADARGGEEGRIRDGECLCCSSTSAPTARAS